MTARPTIDEIEEELPWENNWEFDDEEAYRQSQEEERRRVRAAFDQIRVGLDALGKLGKIEALLSVADWINEHYRPPPPSAKRGHNPNRLYSDLEFARVFWEHYLAPRGQKQAILKREYKSLGYRSWERLQDKFREHRGKLSEDEKVFSSVRVYTQFKGD